LKSLKLFWKKNIDDIDDLIGDDYDEDFEAEEE